MGPLVSAAFFFCSGVAESSPRSGSEFELSGCGKPEPVEDPLFSLPAMGEEDAVGEVVVAPLEEEDERAEMTELFRFALEPFFVFSSSLACSRS